VPIIAKFGTPVLQEQMTNNSDTQSIRESVLSLEFVAHISPHPSFAFSYRMINVKSLYIEADSERQVLSARLDTCSRYYGVQRKKKAESSARLERGKGFETWQLK
jgi:hypothetical protein